MLERVPSFTVRSARLHDRAGIDAMLRRCYPVLLAPTYAPALLAAVLPAMTQANPALLERDSWFVAIAGDRERVIGCGGWTPERPGTGALEPGLGHVRHFGTDPEQLRRGVARAIAARMLGSARAAGVERLECYSTLVAERFYASLGFRTLGPMSVTMPRLDADGGLIEFPALRMQLEL